MALLVLAAFGCVAVAASWLLPETPPSLTTASGVIVATLRSLKPFVLMCAGVIVISATFSLSLGVLAFRSRYGGDSGLSLAVDLAGAIPAVVLAAALALGDSDSRAAMVTIGLGLVRAVRMGRVLRGELLLHSSARHVMAARALGLSDHRVLVSHLLPYAFPTWVTQASSSVLYVAAVQTVLAAAGFELRAGQPSLGSLLARGLHAPNLGNMLPFLSVGLLTGALYVVCDAASQRILPLMRPERHERAGHLPAA